MHRGLHHCLNASHGYRPYTIPSAATVGRREVGREDARKNGGWDGVSNGRVGGNKVREGRSDDVREEGSGSGGREGGLRKGTSKEGTERGGTERGRGAREGAREERGTVGGREQGGISREVP